MAKKAAKKKSAGERRPVVAGRKTSPAKSPAPGQVSVSLPAKLVRQLDQHVAEHSSTRDEVIQCALEAFL